MFYIARYIDSRSTAFTDTYGYEVISTAESRDAAYDYIRINNIRGYGVFACEDVKGGEVTIGTIIDSISNYATGNRGYGAYETYYRVRK